MDENDPAIRAEILARLSANKPAWLRSLELLDAQRPILRVPIYCGQEQLSHLEVSADLLTDLLFAGFYSRFCESVLIERKGEPPFFYHRAHQSLEHTAAMMALLFTMPVATRGPTLGKDGRLDWHLSVKRAVKALTRGYRLCQWCGAPYRAAKNSLKCSPECAEAYEAAYGEHRRQQKAAIRSEETEQRLIDEWLGPYSKAERGNLLALYRKAVGKEGAEQTRAFERLLRDFEFDDALSRLHRFVTARSAAKLVARVS